jgi:hypothetical protein
MDNLNELSKDLAQTKYNAEEALRHARWNKPRIEHTRDIFDIVTPVEFTFNYGKGDTSATLNLQFTPPPNNCCCTQCYCAECEFFTDTTNTSFTLLYDILAGSVVKVWINDAITNDFTVTGIREVTVGFSITTNDEIKICYTHEIAFLGPLSCADAKPVSFVGSVDTRTGFTLLDPSASSISAFVGGSIASDGGVYSIANATIPGWFGGPFDSPLTDLQVSNPMNLVDGNTGTCSTQGALALRNWGADGSVNGSVIFRPGAVGSIETFWLIEFNKPVRACNLQYYGDTLGRIDFFDRSGWVTAVGSTTITGSLTTYEWLADTVITAMRLVMPPQYVADDEFNGGGGLGGSFFHPFGLFFYGGHSACEIVLTVVSARCIDLQVSGQL